MIPSAGDTVLLEEQGRLETHQRKTLRDLSFQVPPETAALGITFDYRPRRLQDQARARQQIERAVDEQLASAAAAGVPLHRDQIRPRVLAQPAIAGAQHHLRNLLNLALQDPGGRHRGRWDRNLDDPPCEEVIATSWASPGFVAGPIPSGQWQATLEVHEILEPPCAFQLRIVGRKVAPTPGPSRRGAHRPAPEREFHQPLPAGWLRGELHCHTIASDGAFAIGELLGRARALGLDFLAVTDHNTTAGLEDLPAGHRGLVVIPGCEITTFHGHFLALGLDAGAAPAWYQRARALSPAELAAAVHGRGGLFGLAHPFVLGNPVCCGCRLEADVPRDCVDLLEVWSRGAEEAVACHQALRLFDTLRRAGRPVVAVAGRDWHDVAQERQQAGHPFPATVVRARPEAAGLLTALRRGACYLSTGPVVELRLVAGTRRATLGEQLDLGQHAPSSVTVQVRVEGLEQDARLRLLRDGTPLLERALSPGAAALELPGLRPAPGEVRLELWTTGDLLEARPLVITNPVQIRTPGAGGRP